MIRYKYSVMAKADYTNILGSFTELLDGVRIQSSETPVVGITAIIPLNEEQLNEIFKHYREGLERIKLPREGKFVVTQIRYDGTVDVPLEEPTEINILGSL